MSKTVEAICEEISLLIKNLLEITIENKCDLAIRDEIITLSNDFDKISTKILTEYYCNAKSTTADYVAVLTSQSITYRINSISFRLQNKLNGVKAKRQRKTKETLSQGISYNLTTAYIKKDEICDDCGKPLGIKHDSTYLLCDYCGLLKNAVESRIKDEPADATVKKATHSPLRHYDQWADRIQGIESVALKKEHLELIRAKLAKNKIVARHLTCEVMREVLKDKSVGLSTELNEHTTQLIGKFGGNQPYRLDERETAIAKEYFSRLMYYYEKQHHGEGNRPYYPYFIYKIYEHMFANNKEKLSILKFIHLQGEETLRKHDDDFKAICDEAGPFLGIEYRATLRNK